MSNPAPATPAPDNGLAAASPTMAWIAECRRLADTVAADGAIAFGRLGHCRSPLDLMQVQQDWLMACFTASADSGMRLLGAVTETVAETMTPAAPSEPTFHLPD